MMGRERKSSEVDAFCFKTIIWSNRGKANRTSSASFIEISIENGDHRPEVNFQCVSLKAADNEWVGSSGKTFDLAVPILSLHLLKTTFTHRFSFGTGDFQVRVLRKSLKSLDCY